MTIRESSRCQGLGLMEVLTASLVLSTAMACLLQWQMSAQALDQVSRQRLEASLLIMELSERLMVVRLLSQTLQSLPEQHTMAVCRRNVSCAVAEFVETELVLWREQVARRLPGAALTSAVNQAPSGQWSVAVTLSWAGNHHAENLML